METLKEIQGQKGGISEWSHASELGAETGEALRGHSAQETLHMRNPRPRRWRQKNKVARTISHGGRAPNTGLLPIRLGDNGLLSALHPLCPFPVPHTHTSIVHSQRTAEPLFSPLVLSKTRLWSKNRLEPHCVEPLKWSFSHHMLCLTQMSPTGARVMKAFTAP